MSRLDSQRTPTADESASFRERRDRCVSHAGFRFRHNASVAVAAAGWLTQPRFSRLIIA